MLCLLFPQSKIENYIIFSDTTCIPIDYTYWFIRLRIYHINITDVVTTFRSKNHFVTCFFLVFVFSFAILVIFDTHNENLVAKNAIRASCWKRTCCCCWFFCFFLFVCLFVCFFFVLFWFYFLFVSFFLSFFGLNRSPINYERKKKL